MGRSWTASAIIAAAAAVIVVALVPAVPGPAAATADGTTGVTVFLKPTDPAALTRLADTAGADRVDAAALDRALPSAAAHRAVVADLEARGFTVVRETSWSVTAQAPSSLVATVFGAVRGVLPDLPESLRSLVSAAFSTVGPKVVRPRALDGPELRRAYTSVANTRHGVLPYIGKDRVHRLTIATIQFSGWNRRDLATYAHRHHLRYRPSTLTQVPAGQATVPTRSDGDGAIEVALDQEALLSTAPWAKQRAFFAPNNSAGFADAFAQVLDDVRADRYAYRGGDRHIAALSVSWGACEEQGTSRIRKVVTPILANLVAAGVTVFASSGDDGAYDCKGLLGLPAKGVDFPASSPYVVGVGGTHLTGRRRAAYNGRNWHERAWSCTGTGGCRGSLLSRASGGSGGGESTVFGKPRYQRSVPGTGRMVPDIAADADPATGFVLYSSHLGGTARVGGTSLAAPVSAALFTNMLASRGLRHGIGNIHGALYAAARGSGYRSSFRDIASGTNGEYDAGPGYDMVTGLGAPLWPALGNRFFRGRVPAAHATIERRHPHSPGKWRRVTVHWGGHAPGHPRLLTAVVVVRDGRGRVVLRRNAARPRGSATFTGRRGHRYRLIVQVANSRHVMSATRVAKLRVPRAS